MNLEMLRPLGQVVEAPVIGLIDDVDSTGNTVYIGIPLNNDASVLTSQAKWRIMRISRNGYVTTKALANGSEMFNQIWDNRAILTYTTFA